MKMFSDQQVKDLGATLSEVPGRFQSIHMADAGIRITLPMDVHVTDKMQAVIAKRVIDVVKQAVAIGRVNSDQNLSASGKLNMLRSLEAETAKMLERQLYEAPPIEPGDVATAMDDASVRSFWQAQDAQGIEKHIAAKVLTPRHLEALKRSLIPLGEPMQTIVESQWETHLMTSDAKRFEKVMDSRSDAQWGVAAINQLKEAVSRLAFHDPDAPIKVTRPAPEAAVVARG